MAKKKTQTTIPMSFHHLLSVTLKWHVEQTLQNTQCILLVSQILVSREICRWTVSAYV